jgi:glycogen debranching enzyme
VWDPVNRRAYTSLSRNWSMQKFGGWGVWLDDVLLHALMAGLVDAGLAKENLLAALANARPAGNLACLLTGHDRWVDRSQPPIGAFVVWLLHRRLGDRSILEDAYPVLARNHAWWLATRDGNGDGLYEYGTSAVGAGLYVGTKLAAKDESFMDNSPVHDEARLDPASRTLDAADVGLNSLIALDGEMLALIAAALGDGEAARRYQEEAAGLKARIAERLWDAGRGVFANRRWSGAFVRSLAPTSFFPLLAGAARTEQAQAMREWLRDPGTFGGAWPLPSVTRDDPAFADNVYWRGRIWPPLHFLVWYGLKRYGFAAEAAMLAQSGWRLFERAWAGRKCPENYNAVTGEALDQPDTDDFYGWGALMPFMAVGLAVDVTPWHGWELNAQAGEGRIGPIRSPWGGLVLDVAGGTMTVEIDGRPVLRTSLKLLTGVEFAAGLVKAALPRSGGGDWIRLPGIGPADLHAALLDGRPLAARFEGGHAVLALPECAHPAQFAALLGGARP